MNTGVLEGELHREPLAGLLEVRKSYGPITAVDGVSMNFVPGEVHAIVGENGAGKTTLMKILAGLVHPDAGEVVIRGRSMRLRDRRDGARNGIGFVQQQFALIEELTGAANFLLGHPHGGPLLSMDLAERTLAEVGERLEFRMRPRLRVFELSMEDRQRLEIAIALAWGAEVLILDEPTSSLGGADFLALSQALRRLTSDGKAIVYISHKLPEVMAVADRVSVMRRGSIVATHLETDIRGESDQLVREMLGSLPARLNASAGSDVGEVVVELRDVWTSKALERCSLKALDLVVRRNEIVGVAGVLGSGQVDLAQTLAGIIKPTRGTILPRPRWSAYIPENRVLGGLALELSIVDNAIVKVHKQRPFVRWGLLAAAEIRRFVRTLIKSANVQAPDFEKPVRSLSGGNQQKLVVGRELAGNPDLVVAHNPYAGLDVAATVEVQRRLVEARRRGAGVVVISPDLERLFEVADRLVVIFDGRIVGSVQREQSSLDEIGRWMTGMVPTASNRRTPSDY